MDNTNQILQQIGSTLCANFFIHGVFMELTGTLLIYFYMETFYYSAVRGEKNHVKIIRSKETFEELQVGS